jgi:hypothetical protein
MLRESGDQGLAVGRKDRSIRQVHIGPQSAVDEGRQSVAESAVAVEE